MSISGETMKSVSLLPLIFISTFAFIFESPAAAEGAAYSDASDTTGASNCDQGRQSDKSRAALSEFGGEKCNFPEVGQALAILDIQAGGELSLSNDEIVKKPWSSHSFESAGKIQLVQYIAANLGVRNQNKSFNDTLKEKHFSSEELKTTVILNMADSGFFTRGVVSKKVAKNKAKYQTIDFVFDEVGMGLQRWGMKHLSYAIIILDANGKVLFAKDGPLTEDEVENAITLIETQMS